MFYDINLMDAKYEGQVEGREQGIEQGIELGRAEERAKTEAERRRADAALEELAKYKEKYGEIV